jgi:hypothetical protein
MHLAISAAAQSHRLIALTGELKQEISHWLFLDLWSDPIPWWEEHHICGYRCICFRLGWFYSLPDYARDF